MPVARNFSRPYNPVTSFSASAEVLPTTQVRQSCRNKPTRNVLKKKSSARANGHAPAKSLPSIPQVIVEDEPFRPTDVYGLHLPQRSEPSLLPNHNIITQPQPRPHALREPYHSQKLQPLASHPDTMSFAQAPATVSMPDLSSIPCYNSCSIFHSLTCGHTVCTPQLAVCGPNCTSEHADFESIMNSTNNQQPFTCHACLEALLDAKYKDKRDRFMREVDCMRLHMGERADELVRERREAMERVWKRGRMLDRKMLVGLGRASHVSNRL